MANLTFHDFLVERAIFPFPETVIGGTVTSTDISLVDVGIIHNDWKATHAVRDNELARKLCDALKSILGETPLTERSERSLLRSFLPALQLLTGNDDDDDDELIDERWLKNPSEAHVSVILVLFAIQVEPLGQSRRLLDLGVFTAAGRCLGKYDRCKFKALSEQKVAVAKSAVDFYALINGEPVALVEAKSPRVMDKLGELLPRNGFEMRWTPGSSILTSLVFSKVGVWFPIWGSSFNTHSRLRSISV
jgi:hypothetical protein